MSDKKLGRPTNGPKILSTRIRLSKSDIQKLEYCSKILNKPKSDVIRMGIDKVYNQIKD